MSTQDIGDLIRVSRTFLNAAGAAADPSAVVFTLKDPEGVITTPPATDDTGTGNYYVDVTPTVAGVYRYKWTSTGDPQLMDQGTFTVRRDRTE